MVLPPQQRTPSLSVFDEAYTTRTAPWVIGEPQPAVVTLERARYVQSLHRACRPGAVVHLLALADTGPGFGPQVSDTAIRDAFSQGWVLEELNTAQYRGVIIRDEHAAALNRPNGALVDLPARLARARRI